MSITLDDLITAFQFAMDAIDSDGAEPDPESLYLEVILSELRVIELSFAAIDVSEEVKLSVAASRIPGVLHLYKLY